MPEFASQSDRFAAQLVREITDAVVTSNYIRASALAETAAAQGVIHPMIHIARALRLQSLGRDQDALASYREARTLSPRNARLLNAIGLCLVRLHRLDEALQSFDEAVRLEPAAPAAHQHKGMVLGLAGRVDDAERAYERALKLDPRNVETLASLASLANRKGNADGARKYAERALALDPRNPNAHIALAIVEVGDRQYKPAIERLRAVADNPAIAGQERSVALALMGDALDGEGDASEAFAAYAAANAERLKLNKDRFRGQKSAGEILDEVIAAFANSIPARWNTPEISDGTGEVPRTHVFLLGFPRTGTTILEQALECHPEVVTLDERDFLADIAEEFLTSAAGLERLSSLDAKALAAHRETYWQRVKALKPNLAHRVFVDKQPFNTIKLPLIVKLFPEAKVLFAIRDPRDVVLSCFRRQLDVDLVRFEFLTLEGAAGVYERFMRLAELCRGKLPLPILDHRYEDLIADFDAATNRVCDFLGVTWSASMGNFGVAARALEANKASTGQLRRGLYTEGVGQWRRYREQLSPALPQLQHWIARFGYPET